MSEEEKTQQPAEVEEVESEAEMVEEVAKEKSGFPILAIVVVISLILAIAAAAGVGVSWFKNEQQLLNQTQSINSLKNKIDALQQAQQVNKNISATMQASLNKQQQEISKQLEKITEKLGRNRHDWAVSEIRYTLRQANMRLQLFKDKTTALVALQLADSQLAKLGDPALYKLRGVVNKEIAALRVVKEIDLEGISLRLTALTEQVKNLEVSVTQRSKQNKPANIPLVSDAGNLEQWQKHADAIWEELKTLVTIRRTDKKILPLLSEQESKQLRQALSLKIEIARLALLQQNTTLFRSSLQAATNWLKEYFNADQSAVMSITKELNNLMSVQLEPVYPDISGSLSMLEQSQVGSAVKVRPVAVKKIEKKPAPKPKLKSKPKTEKPVPKKKTEKSPASKEKQAQ